MDKNHSVMEKLALLKSQLTGRKTTMGFVKFPMPTEEAALYIEAALQVEVEKRGRTFGDSDELQGHIVQIARIFTEPTTKFGILLCGSVGNGKSSIAAIWFNSIANMATNLITSRLNILIFI